MSTDHRDRLVSIRRFDQLLAYLRDEMGWPIDRIEIDELMFDYTSEELGIDPRNAAKISEIKRLRPLSTNQPWGIFFVKFEPKKLPVVALRRILSQVVLKKRAKAKAADRAVWAADDLLFISNYGEGDERRITFAHFSHPEASNDLPTLKVLGWDNLDTPLHLDAVAKELTNNLAWPNDEDNVEEWRRNWRSAFILRHREVITTSRDLSIRLAELARATRDRIKTTLAIETSTGPLTKLMKAFQASLVHDLDTGGFADMYAQTIAYGLLSARIADPHKKTVDDFADHMRTNPFLRELMETFLKVGGRRGKSGGPGIDFDELGVNEVVELLDNANMEAVIRDFGDRNPQEDPVIHFYELFLKEYDAKKRMQRGVFYTPRPVVSYIVRSVDELLRTEFGLVDGLADTTTWGEMAKRHKDLKVPEGVSGDQAFVQILDPATGTGTFLVEVIDLIYRRMMEKWKTQRHGDKKIEVLWNEYVPKHLLPRLHGYELLMAPYAIAHLKIGLKLYETGYRFDSDERARIYLTNALEPASDVGQMRLAGVLPALAHEAQAVNEVKQKQRFTIVIGNPPYSGHSANTGKWITNRIRDYYFVDGKPLGERNPKWLQDDYVKFIRFGQFCVQETSSGILSFITNHGYIENPTFRGMRQELLSTFSSSYVVDLHGNVKKGSGGSSDQNVFDIQQGVAISVYVRASCKSHCPKVFHGEMKGDRGKKYNQLLLETIIQTENFEIQPASPFYLLVPQTKSLRDEFALGTTLQSIFRESTMGITTGRDQICVSFSAEEALLKLNEFTSNMPESELASKFGLSNKSGWNIEAARRVVRSIGVSKKRIHPFSYRPFDTRFLYLDSAIVGRPRLSVMRSMLSGKNIALCITRQVNGEYRHALCTRHLSNDCFLSSESGERTYLFPLFNEPDRNTILLNEGRELNLSNEFLSNLASKLGIRSQDSQDWIPNITFNYVYAVFHSPGYRNRYAESLKIDFPRLPLTGNLDLFHTLAHLGGELVALHLMESRKLDHFITNYTGPPKPEVVRIGWSDNTVWLDAAATKKGQPAKRGNIGFKGVPEDVWNFHIGGYQVCEKWLKDRKGRTLSKDDITHYQKIVVALFETNRLMKEIDKVIDKHGGWPGAFALSASTSVAKTHEAAEISLDNVVPLHPTEKKDEQTTYVYEPEPMLKAAESPDRQYEAKSSANKSAEQTERPEEIDREEILCLVRQAFSDGIGRERGSAINELARTLGYHRTGSRVQEELDNALRSAVRRGILENQDGTLRLFLRSIEQYDRDFLKEQFLASLIGRQWTEREDAIRGFARWLGFRRTGPSIDETARSLINGLIRESRLESDGSMIRRS